MGLTRTCLRPVAYLAGRHAARQCRAFLDAHKQTRTLQDRLLADLIRSHAQTDFGRDHGFSAIRTYADFASAVPVGSYQTLGPYMERVLEGHTQALLPPGEDVLMFSQTSGTTGRSKLIPVTRRFLSDMRRGWNIFGLKVLRDHPKAWLRHIVQISSSMRETLSPTGLPCGAISGMLAVTQKKIVRRMYVVPTDVWEIADAPSRFYTMLRCSIEHDVAFITTANPSSTIKLIETGQQNVERLLRDLADGMLRPPRELPIELARRLRFRPNPALARRLDQSIRRDGQLLPRHFWNLAFLANWTGGTLKLYLRRLGELFGDVPVRDIGLLASEGRLSIPLDDGTPAGVADILSNFLEFIPAAQRRDDPSGGTGAGVPTLRAHELEVGGEYFVVLSNWAGLWRYNLDDRIRVTGRLGDSPVLEFLSRGVSTASITGEKITEHQVVEAMRTAAARSSTRIERFVLQGRFAHTPYYELRVEPPADTAVGSLAELMDQALGELNPEYHSKRSSGRLDSIRAVVQPPGTFETQELAWITRRGGRSEQYKHQYLLTEVLVD